MTVKFRPNGYYEIREKMIADSGISRIELWQIELGADAMLEAIDKLAKESPTGTFTFDSRVNDIGIVG